MMNFILIKFKWKHESYHESKKEHYNILNYEILIKLTMSFIMS